MERPTKEQIRLLPLYMGLELGKIKLVENEQDAQQALTALSDATSLGFDTETKPIFRKGVLCPGPTLIQLATATQVFLFPTRFSAAVSVVKLLLGNAQIKKVGFGLSGDIKELRNKLDINLENTFDLSVALKKIAGEKIKLVRVPLSQWSLNQGYLKVHNNQIGARTHLVNTRFIMLPMMHIVLFVLLMF